MVKRNVGLQSEKSYVTVKYCIMVKSLGFLLYWFSYETNNAKKNFVDIVDEVWRLANYVVASYI